jgi:hypothetical protein
MQLSFTFFLVFSSLNQIATLPTESCYILIRITFITYITSQAKLLASQPRGGQVVLVV